jgi:hypothetical protein
MSANRLTAVALLTSMLLLGFVAWKVRTLSDPLAIQNQEFTMQTMTSTWTSGTTSHTVSTPRGDGQTVAAWAAAHKEALDAMQALFPPNAD